jgi:RNA-directed DNA polymerase
MKNKSNKNIIKKSRMKRGMNESRTVAEDVKLLGPSIIQVSTMSRTDEKKSRKEEGWHDIDWKRVKEVVGDYQEKIVIATLNKDMKKVYNLQWKLLTCPEARALAIKRVVTNKGGKTAGTDKQVWKGPQEYWAAMKELESIINDYKNYRASPVRRVWIPKGNSKELRPLGIPTMIDRAVQAIYHLGVDPAVEATSDPNSFGFRKNRSTHDAITALRSLLDKDNHPRWILEADISKCFEKINHEFLMKHTPICHKEVLDQWLKAGILEELNYTASLEGTPQGGIMSPTLCNIALNGIEKTMKKANPLIRGISPGVHIIRYADDMVITAKSQEIAIHCKSILSKFLAERGLSLNENKTLITHIKEGFDFLGFNIKRMKWNPRYNDKTDQETVLIIKPSKKGISKLKNKIREIIKMNSPIIKIIKEINPVLRGWGEHKRISYHTQPVFIKLDHWIYKKMRKWASWKKGSNKKIINKYLIRTASRKWNWGISQRNKIVNLGEIAIIQLRPLKLDKNPYVKENMEYYNKRREKLIDAKFRAIIYKKWKHICPVCENTLHNDEAVELHHIVPKKSGGKYSIENILPLHKICHQQVTYGNKSLERLKITKPITRKSKISRNTTKLEN